MKILFMIFFILVLIILIAFIICAMKLNSIIEKENDKNGKDME